MIVVMITTVILAAIIFDSLLCATDNVRHIYHLTFQISGSSHISQMEVHLENAGFEIRRV
jgi:hypothetical protein